ncbi:MAG: TrmH family RNA methyltransferase [Hyphomonadaceae bacterium]
MLHRVTSAANPSVKLLKSLASKKGRQETGLFLAEGARLAHEAAELGFWPEIMLISESVLDRPYAARLAEGAQLAGARVIAASERVLEQIARRENPQAVIGAYRQRWAEPDALLQSDLCVALNEVRDPGNLGTILRTCDAVGAGGAILIGNCCDPFSVEAVRASMGSIFAAPVARASFEEANAARKARGADLIGTSLKGHTPHDAPKADNPILLMMGNEQAGLPPELEDACDELVRIPMRGHADSLNLAAATAIMLYDIWRRRGYAGARS